MPVWAVMGLAWNLLSGYSGFVSFGHAAFFGLGAYFVALARSTGACRHGSAFPVRPCVGALAGLSVGFPTFRLRGHYFALAMLAYPLALLYVFEWLGTRNSRCRWSATQPLAYMQFEDHRIYAWLALALMLGAMVLTSLVERSRFGMSLVAIKQDEAAAEAAGIDTLTWKLRAITLSGAMAGAAGGFYAVVLLVVTPPAVFGMLVSAQALIVTMFGGVGTLWGPVIGSVVLVPLSEFLHARLGNVIPGIQGVVYGIAIVVVILLAPEGVFWKIKTCCCARRLRESGRSAGRVAAASRRDAAAGPRQGTRSDRRSCSRCAIVSKAFGGLKAVQDVSIQVFSKARSSASSGRTAPARPRCSTCSTVSSGPTRARSCSKATTSPAGGPTRSARRAWAAHSRSSAVSAHDGAGERRGRRLCACGHRTKRRATSRKTR